MAQTASTILQGFRVTLFYDFDHYMRDADRKRGIYGMSYEGSRANFGAEVVKSRDEATPTAAVAKGDGWDVFLTPFFKEKGKGPEALLRFDHWTPDTSKTDLRERVVAGLSYWWTPKAPAGVSAALMLDYEGVTVKNPTSLQPDQRRLTLHTVLSF